MIKDTDFGTNVDYLAPIEYNHICGGAENESIYWVGNRWIESQVYRYIRTRTCGFLNAEGGIIYIGIQNDGTVIGIDNIDNTLKNISDCITDQIEPSPRGEVVSKIIHEENRSIIELLM